MLSLRRSTFIVAIILVLTGWSPHGTISGGVAPSLTGAPLNGSSPVSNAGVVGNVSASASLTSCAITGGNSAGNFACAPSGANAQISYTSTGATNLNGATDLAPFTLTVTGTNANGTSLGVSVPINVYADGPVSAPAATVQHPHLLDLSSTTNGLGHNLVTRPPWKGAGVDYAVGYPTATSLIDWQSISMAGVSVNAGTHTVTISGNGVTLDSIDFSLHGGAQVVVTGANDTISNSNLLYSSTLQGLGVGGLIGATGAASNLTVTYCIIDGTGASNSTQTTLIGSSATGSKTFKYNWLKNFNQHAIELSAGGGTVVYEFNLIENGGSGAAGQHLNYLQFSGTTAFTSVLVEFNTTYQPTNPISGGEGFQGYANNSANVISTVSYNTMIASPKGDGLAHLPSSDANGFASIATSTMQSNFIDKGSSTTFWYPDSGNAGYSVNTGTGHVTDTHGNSLFYLGNVNMLTAAVIPAS